LQQYTIRHIEAFDVGGYHAASSIEESNCTACEPVVTPIDLGCGFQAATLRNVIDKINHNQEPNPMSFVEKTLHSRLMRAFQKTDLYAGMTFIGYRVPQEPNANHAKTTQTSFHHVAA
jgi:hypothetical protein